MESKEIRSLFLEFFREKGHIVKESSSLIPRDDPTLLFTSAGMNQFKKEFLGEGDPTLKRACSCQKCFRTSDIDEVGKTGRHHTFFEMLGNFSFGDYFKEEAITWAWELVREKFKIPEDSLWITIYYQDEEAFKIWRDKIGVREEKILRLGEDTNFWEMGPTGPCGPCSEIVVDRGEEFSCGKPTCGVNCDCDRFVELWNLVFTQFDRKEDGTLEPLPRKNIDTGMGLERACAILQGKRDNFLTDLFKPIIVNLENLTSLTYSSHTYSFRVIADHIRAITFLINDGVLPSNTGRGYVLRRLIRRALAQGRKLALHPPFLYRLVGAVVNKMGDFYPDLRLRKEHIIQVLHGEETTFSQTLEEGMEMLKEIMEKAKEKRISGKDLFRLYDTYGFPLELAEELIREEGYEIDRKGFQEEMEKQKLRARQAWEKERREISLSGKIYTQLKEKFGPTKFIGYETLEGKGKVLTLIKEGKEKEKAEKGEEIEILVDPTPFYAESGGQVGDTGYIKTQNGVVRVLDTYYGEENLIISKGKVIEGSIEKGEEVWCEVDRERRKNIAIHHTSTHLLQYALREVLGTHVYQAGSWVGEDFFRFDFTHYSPLHPDELKRVEEIVNEKIRENAEVKIKFLPLEEAKKEGAIALFGEKYGETVRMVEIGDFSKELCGGTHLSSTGEIGVFLILEESSVGTGVRRIVAVGGKKAYEKIRKEREIIETLSEILRSPKEEIDKKVKNLLDEIKKTEKEKEKVLYAWIMEKVKTALDNPEIINGIHFFYLEINTGSKEVLRQSIDFFRSKVKEKGVFLVVLKTEGRLNLVLGITDDLVKEGLHAGNLIREVAKITGGGGGGKPYMGEAGGRNPEKLKDAVEFLKREISHAGD